MTMIDNFSRFVDLYQCKTTAAEGTAEALLNFCGRYGTPNSIRTDRGPLFKNEIIAELTKTLGLNHHFITA
jgi:hypothetical protein